MTRRALWIACLVVACLVVACLVTAGASAQQCGGDAVCVPQEDLQKFVALARERQCLDDKDPVFTIDSIAVVTDADGRVFYSGADPKKPYKLTMRWCGLSVEAEGQVELVAGIRTPETSGFRFRPKAYLGYLPLKLADRDFNDGIDAGMLIDLAYVDWVNFNLAAGFRSVGGGVGFDITQNFGGYAGYALGWASPPHNVNVALYFAF